jgi:hypothetical protein
MQCVDLSDLLSAYADGQTLPAQSEAVEAHLAGCAYCRRVLARFKQTNTLLSLTRGETWTPPDLRLRVRLAYQRAEQPKRRSVWLAAITAGVAAAGLTGAVIFSQAQTLVTGATPTTQQPAVQGGAQAMVRPRAVHPASVADCPRQSILGIARCLGVSRATVPTILLEERDAHLLALRLSNTSVAASRSRPATATGTADLKGGGARGLNNGNHRGMQAI